MKIFEILVSTVFLSLNLGDFVVCCYWHNRLLLHGITPSWLIGKTVDAHKKLGDTKPQERENLMLPLQHNLSSSSRSAPHPSGVSSTVWTSKLPGIVPFGDFSSDGHETRRCQIDSGFVSYPGSWGIGLGSLEMSWECREIIVVSYSIEPLDGSNWVDIQIWIDVWPFDLSNASFGTNIGPQGVCK